MSPLARFKGLEPSQRSIVILGALCIALALMGGSWAYAYVASDHASSAQSVAATANNAADTANKAAELAKQIAQSDCGSWRDIASIAPPPETKSLQLWADFRKTYFGKDCVPISGPLPPADPRLLSLLPPADR